MTIEEIVTEKATEYLGYEPSMLVVDMAIEVFIDLINFPNSYSNEKKESILIKNVNKIAMAVIEYDAKDGAEGQTSHSENGISRSYGDSSIPKAYSMVVPYAKVF